MVGCAILIGVCLARGAEVLVIATSPSVKAPLESLSRAFETAHPGVQVKLSLHDGLDLRRTIAAINNNAAYLGGRGVIHVIAPGGDELLTRLEAKNYVRPNTRRAYAAERLVLVVPVSLVEAPDSFDELSSKTNVKIAVADPTVTNLGRNSRSLLSALGIWETSQERIEVAADARGVIDHMMRGEADVGILWGPDAAQEQDRVRVVAERDAEQPVVHSIAMDSECPNRNLAQAFLDFTRSQGARKLLRALGYAAPDENPSKRDGG